MFTVTVEHQFLESYAQLIFVELQSLIGKAAIAECDLAHMLEQIMTLLPDTGVRTMGSDNSRKVPKRDFNTCTGDVNHRSLRPRQFKIATVRPVQMYAGSANCS